MQNLKIKSMLLFFIISTLFVSCDMLRKAPFEVAAWTPGSGYIDINGGVTISALFSSEPDRESVERSFELSEDGVKRGGSFYWDGNKIFFMPQAPLEHNRDYKIVINKTAQDKNGISLDESFSAAWTTRPKDTRPAVIEISPADNEEITGGFAPITVIFSTPISLPSLNKYVSFTPTLQGNWQFDNSLKKAVFTPVSRWKNGIKYKMTINAFLESAYGLTLGAEKVSHFIIAGETILPEIIAVRAIQNDWQYGDAAVFSLREAPVENTAFENNYKLLIEFSEKVNVGAIKNLITFEPAVSFSIDWESINNTTEKSVFNDFAVIKFNEKPTYNTRYLLKIASRIKDMAGNESAAKKEYKILLDGERSMPPALERLKITGADYSGDYNIENTFDLLPQTPAGKVITDGNIEIILYFKTALGANINLFSLMELFSFSSVNGYLSLTTSNMEYGGTIDGFETVIINGAFKTTAIHPDIVTFSIGAGILDTLDNFNKNAQRITLVK